jgi:hypothetical protein
MLRRYIYNIYIYIYGLQSVSALQGLYYCATATTKKGEVSASLVLRTMDGG